MFRLYTSDQPKNIHFLKNLPMNILIKFGSNWHNGFREDLKQTTPFLQLWAFIVYFRLIKKTYSFKRTIQWTFLPSSYSLFQRRRLKCKSLTTMTMPRTSSPNKASFFLDMTFSKRVITALKLVLSTFQNNMHISIWL